MKIGFCLLVVIVFHQACGNQALTAENAQNGSKKAQGFTEIRYEASTRGFYEMLWIGDRTLTLTNDRSHNQKAVYPIAENNWNELTALLKDVDILTLPSLEAPTSKRHHDAAAFATLTVVQDGAEIQTQNFDHGDPPKPIEALVAKILSLAEGVKKK